MFDAGYLRAVASRFGPGNPIPVLADQAIPLALHVARDDGSPAALEVIAKLVTVRDNYQVDAGTVPLVLLEAVGRVSGRAAAHNLATHIIKRSIDYDPDDTSSQADPFEPLSSSAAATVSAFVRAGLADMARTYALDEDSREVKEAYARALLSQGDRQGAIEAAHALASSIEEAVNEDQRTLDAYFAAFERAATRLVDDADEKTQSSSSSLGEFALSVIAAEEETFEAQAPSVLGVYDNFRSRSKCVRLFREAGDHESASALARGLLAQYRSLGQFRSAVTLDVAAALVWGGHVLEAWEVIRAIADVVIEGVPEEALEDYPGDLADEALVTVFTLRGRPGVADHPFVHPGARVIDLVRKAPTLPLIEAFLATGNRVDAHRFLEEYVQGREYAQVHAALLVKVGTPDEAFTTIHALETLPNHTPGLEASAPFSISWHKIALFSLLACEHPESAIAARSVDQIKSLISDAHQEAQPVLLNQLAIALIALRRDDEFDSIVEQLDDPADALLRGVKAGARRGDLQTVVRYGDHPQWAKLSSSVAHRIPALCLLAICHQDAANSEQATRAVSGALALAVSPSVVTSTRYREILDAAMGRGFDWERMLLDGLKPGVETIGVAANWLEEPQAHHVALVEATIATVKLWMRSRGIPGHQSPDEETDRLGDPSEPSTGRPIEALIGGRAPAGWEGWLLVFTALAHAFDRAGDDASFPLNFAFRAALDERTFDDPGRPSPPLALGYLLIAIARIGVELEPGEVRLVQEALDESNRRFQQSLAFTGKRSGAAALWAAAESMSRVAIGQRGDAHALVIKAAGVLATPESAGLTAQDRDFGLTWCVKTLSFLGEPDRAALLLGYIVGAPAAAQANFSLAESYLDKGEVSAAVQHAARGLSEYVDPRTLRRLDPDLIPAVAAFEEQLWKANTSS